MKNLSPDFLLPSPLQALHDEHTQKAGISLFIKREDLIHEQISGNKYRKLKYNLTQARAQKHDTLLTFGGAHSNHIYATAAAGYLHGFRAIGIIRGEETLPLNETLAFAQAAGMQLHYINRTDYRRKTEENFILQLRQQFGGFYLVPEGGSNAHAVRGCSEIIAELPPFDYVACACGTGGTLAGLAAGIVEQKRNAQALGFAVLKGADFLYQDIDALLKAYHTHYIGADFSQETYQNAYQLHLDFHFGGYAKQKPELTNFIEWFEAKHHIKIEFVYTGKILFGIYELIKQNRFQAGQKIVVLHTGGLR